MNRARTIRVEALTRVEGEGGLFIRFRGDRVDEIQLSIYEPPRLFEALLRGRPLEEVPDITARICGICPVAYQMSSTHALESALGVSVSPEIRRLRRLLYCGEWIESHALHMFLLHAPDFLGFDNAWEMAEDYPDEVQGGLELKKQGNRLLEVLGGRAIHPINVAVGGFFRTPSREQVTALISGFEAALKIAVKLTRWVARFDFPDFQRPYEMIALVHPDEYPMNAGRIASSEGWSIDVEQFADEFEERQVPHSTALHAVRKATDSCYFVGPLARLNLNLDRLMPAARQVADAVSIEWPCTNPFQSIVARGIEIVHAFEEALSIMRDYQPVRPPRHAYEHHDGAGCAATEAPRGLLYHHYEIGADGLVKSATIIPPTSQNQAQIEDDLKAYVSQIKADDDVIASSCERLVRSYDPCISCSTHFLKVKLERA